MAVVVEVGLLLAVGAVGAVGAVVAAALALGTQDEGTDRHWWWW